MLQKSAKGCRFEPGFRLHFFLVHVVILSKMKLSSLPYSDGNLTFGAASFGVNKSATTNELSSYP